MDYTVSTHISHLSLELARSLPESLLHTNWFVKRILYRHDVASLSPIFENMEVAEGMGFATTAGLGFQMVIQPTRCVELAERFFNGVERIRLRQRGLETFTVDDIAVLGIAEGLHALGQTEGDFPLAQSKDWLLGIIDTTSSPKAWTYRLRQLSGDILDGRGRLRSSVDYEEAGTKFLEVCMRDTWPEQFVGLSALDHSDFEEIMLSSMTQDVSSLHTEFTGVVLAATLAVLKGLSKRLVPPSTREQATLEVLIQIDRAIELRANRQVRTVFVACLLTLSVALFTTIYLNMTDIISFGTVEATLTYASLVTSIVVIFLNIFGVSNIGTVEGLRRFLIKKRQSQLYRSLSVEKDAVARLIKSE